MFKHAWPLIALTLASRAVDAAPGVVINACDYLSSEEVSAVLGMPVEAGVRDDAGLTRDEAYSSTCLWRVAADRGKADPNRPLGGASFAILNAQSWPAGTGTGKKFLEDFRDAGRNHEIAMIPVAVDMGDEALWWGSGIAVLKGDITVGLSVHLVTDRRRERALAETLAAKIVAKLP
jgi:hypothetical protein